LTFPPVDLGKVMDRVQSVISTIQKHDSTERFCGLGADVRFGHPVFIDEHVIEIDGARLSARAWIVSTGSRPALPPVEGLAEVPHWTNETVFSQRTLPNRLLVLGGGPIGLEMAHAFQRLGSHVTVVEFMDQILGPEDTDIADILKSRLEGDGMTILSSTKAIKAESRGSTIRLTVGPAQGDGEVSVLEADALLVAAGRKPNTEKLELEAAGVEYTPRGISTDARMRTNMPHIYACGDVNGQFPFTHVAGYEAGIALSNIILRLPRKSALSKVAWCNYTDPQLASIGIYEEHAKTENVEYRILEEHFSENDRALAEGEKLGKIKVLISPKGKLLGCQIIGPHAGELIHEWVGAVWGGMKLSTLAGAIHVYPTLSEISKRAAGSYFAEKLFSDRTRSILRHLFHLKGRACTLPDGAE